jgi:type I restriction enzyme, S subunit
MEENEKQLPVGWVDVTIGEIAKRIHYGFTATAKNCSAGTKYLRITDIQNGIVNWNSVPYCEIKDEEKKKYKLNENDLVFARTGGTVGKSFLIKKDVPNAVFASYLIRVICSNFILPSYVYYFFQTSSYWSQINIGKVGLKTNVNAQILSSIKLQLPPLAEQHRIVAKIEELFSDLDAAVQSLEKARDQLKIYRQAVLKYAFEGKLTEEWRKRQRGRLEPAKRLLETIKKERDIQWDKRMQRWEKEVEEWQNGGKVGKKPAKPKKLKELPSLAEEEIKDLPKLTEGWKWIKISQIGTVKGGKRLPKNCNFSEFSTANLYIMAGNLKTGTVIGNPKYIDDSVYSRLFNYRVFGGEVYVTIVGACIGDAGVIPNNLGNAVLTENAAKIVYLLNTNNIYLSWWLRSPLCKDYIKMKILSATLGKLALSRIESLPFPICSLDEQQQIVTEIERRLSVCDKLEQTVEESIKKAAALRQSILKKAFEGKLVPQDPNDEPAEILLERIRKQREEQAQKENMKPKKNMNKNTNNNKKGNPS